MYIYVLILLYICPHTLMHVSAYSYICVLVVILKRDSIALRLLYVSSYYYICVLTLLVTHEDTYNSMRTHIQYDDTYIHMCPHTVIYVSA